MTTTTDRRSTSHLPESMNSNWVAAVVATLVAVVGWQIIVWLSGGWVPGLPAIFGSVAENLVDPETYTGALITFRRLGIAFVGATVVGIALGVVMALSPSFDAFWRPLVVVALAIPDPVYFIVLILILGTAESVSQLALTLAVTPFVVMIALGAVSARDTGLDEMSRVYRLPRRTYLKEVLGRQLAPGFIAAGRTSFAFSWKIVVLMEAITQPDGIGFQIYNAFRLLRPYEMIALSLIFILFMQIVERVIFGTAERRLLAWQR